MICSSWNIDRDWLKLIILGHFLPFCPFALKTQKIKIWKKRLEMSSSFYTCVPKITIIHIYPGIWNETDIIFCHSGHFLPFCPPNDLKNQNSEKLKKKAHLEISFYHVDHMWQSYNVWFLRYGSQGTEIFVILGHFLPFYPTNKQQNLNFEKWKKLLETSFFTCVP